MPNPLAQFRFFVACCPRIFDPYFRCDGSDTGLVTLIGSEAFFVCTAAEAERQVNAMYT